MINTRSSRPDDAARVIEVWRRAVDATHDFLDPADRQAIDLEVQEFLPQVPMTLAVDGSDRAVGFMFVHDGHMEALFIDPDHHGQGIGRMLVQSALQQHPQLTTDVNAQNRQAVGFYEAMGFVRTGESDRDGQGRPYPLINLAFRPSS